MVCPGGGFRVRNLGSARAYFNVSFPSFGMIAPPLSVSSATVTWWMGVFEYESGRPGAGAEGLLVESMMTKTRKPATPRM